jgi:preprotein translocase SecE subunit
MATVEKEIVEYAPPSPYQRLRLGSFLGTVFVLGGVWLILAGLPWFWNEFVALERNPFLSGALLILVEILAIAAFVFLGRKLEGPNPAHGLRAGIFVLSMWVLVTLWICSKVAWGIGEHNAQTGMVVTVVVFGALMFFAYWLFRKDGFCQWLEHLEDSGWFHATGYKSNQGLRVRRCTVVALLILGGCGIWVMTRGMASTDWKMTIPFLGQPGSHLGASFDDVSGVGIKVTNVEARSPAATARLKLGDLIKHIDDEKTAATQAALTEVLSNRAGGEALKLTGTRQADGKDDPLSIQVVLASAHPALPLLYQAPLTVPLILVGLLVWLSWRIVNLPVFADFLIATEAEMNKVSWTTPQRLKQDTIVVLVTVIFLSLFLFFIDIMWIKFLSWDWIGVLRVDVRAEVQRQQEQTQW